MARYGEAFRNRVVARLLPPESASVGSVAKEIGVSVQTLERTLRSVPCTRGAAIRPIMPGSGHPATHCLPTTGTYLLPPLLKAFGKAHPEIEVILREESSPQLARMLRESEVDLAIMDEEGLGNGLRSEVLFSEPLLIVVPPKHRFASRKKLALRALADEPMILMKSGHGFRQIVLDALSRAGIQPRVVYETGEIDTVQALVKVGMGLSLVPKMVKRPGLIYLEILPPTPSRTVHIAWRDDSVPSPAALALKKIAIASPK